MKMVRGTVGTAAAPSVISTDLLATLSASMKAKISLRKVTTVILWRPLVTVTSRGGVAAVGSKSGGGACLALAASVAVIGREMSSA